MQKIFWDGWMIRSILELFWRWSQSGGTEMGWTCPEEEQLMSIEGYLLEVTWMQRDRVSRYTITPVQTKHTASLAAGSINVSELEWRSGEFQYYNIKFLCSEGFSAVSILLKQSFNNKKEWPLCSATNLYYIVSELTWYHSIPWFKANIWEHIIKL